MWNTLTLLWTDFAILLFNIYLLAQSAPLCSTRVALIRELVLNERLESLSRIDPLTQLLQRRALNESARSRAFQPFSGSSLTFMAIELGFSGMIFQVRALEGDKVLIDFAKILRSVFRGADLAFRKGGDEFPIMLPDTTGKRPLPNSLLFRKQ